MFMNTNDDLLQTETKWLERILDVLKQQTGILGTPLLYEQLILVYTAVDSSLFYWYNLIKIHIVIMFMWRNYQCVLICVLTYQEYHTNLILLQFKQWSVMRVEGIYLCP